MSCFVKQIKSCEIFGDTINSRIFSFDISVKKVNALIQKNDSLNITHKILEINDNKHILNIEDLNLIIGNYKITYIFEILINGKQIKKTFCIEELVIKKAGCNCNEVINELNFIINLEEINIPVNIDFSITNINGQGGDLSWGNINGNIENQADLIQKFGDYYTKPQSDARFKSISYTPNWSEVSGKPTTFTPSAHTHTIAEIDNLQNTLANKVDEVIGKQLSTEDYTTAEKNKLAGIQEGAEANVNADWNATSGDTQILNKPTVFTPSTHIHNIADVNNLQTALDTKLSIETTSITGTEVSFTNDRIYGSLASPETANITANTANAKLGVTNIIIHNSGTVPTFGSQFKKLSGSGSYVVGVVNYIYCTFITATEIIYSINQRS